VARLLDDLNDLSPIDHGKLALRLQRIELATVMTDAIQNVLPRIERRRQRLLVSVPPAPVELQADPVRIVQVLAT
jgi:signal transduction histidine kinase